MTSVSSFEESIANFTLSRIGEKVHIDLLGENIVVFQPLHKRGSVSLGDFWIHVLQHPNNYPVYSYAYRKLYRAGKKFEIQLNVDGITLTIDLASGCLSMKGSHVIDWIVNCFPEIMKSYSSPQRTVSRETHALYTKEEMKALQQERKKFYEKYIDDWPENAINTSADLTHVGKNQDYHEAVDHDGFLKGVDLETHNPAADLLNKQETKEQLNKLVAGRAIQGIVLYRLWKSTLNLWFSDKNAKVFIVTPYIDCLRLTDICKLVLSNRLSASLDTFCVQINHMCGKFADARRETFKKFSPENQVFLEYRVFSSVVYPLADYMTSFIAMVKKDKARILLTNINFDRASFLTLSSATVLFEKIEAEKFMKEFCSNFS